MMTQRYRQFLGTKPGSVVELVDSSNSPYLVRAADGFEFSISAEDFRSYYRPEGSSTPSRWLPFVTDPSTGLVESRKMSQVVEIVHEAETVLEDFDKARRFLRDALDVLQKRPGLEYHSFGKELQKVGWAPESVPQRLYEVVLKIPRDISELLRSETCGVVELPTGSDDEQVPGSEAATRGPSDVSGKRPGPAKKASPKNRRVGMKNAEMAVEGDLLIVTVDLSKELGPSKSGKTTIVASSEGNRSVPGRPEKIGLNIYRQEAKRPAKGRRQSFKNVEVDVAGEILTIRVDLSKEFGPSRSGKTIIVASTEGNQLVFGREEKIGLNVYRKIE